MTIIQAYTIGSLKKHAFHFSFKTWQNNCINNQSNLGIGLGINIMPYFGLFVSKQSGISKIFSTKKHAVAIEIQSQKYLFMILLIV